MNSSPRIPQFRIHSILFSSIPLNDSCCSEGAIRNCFYSHKGHQYTQDTLIYTFTIITVVECKQSYSNVFP